MTKAIVRTAILVAALFIGIAWAAPSQAAPMKFKVQLSGAQQVPPVTTAGTGSADITYDPATHAISWTVTYSGLSGTATMAHFHGPAAAGANGPVLVWLSKQGAPAASPFSGQATLTPAQETELTTGQVYINVHTAAHPSGEIRGQVMLPKM